MYKLFIFITVAFLLASASSFAQSTWTFDDAHSNLRFSITNLMVSEIEGSFQIKEATLLTPKEDFTDAIVSIVADAKTIDTDQDARDEHLRSPDFFDTEKYPSITFTSSSFKKVSDTKYVVDGILTMHGISKPVTLDIIGITNVRSYDNKTIVGFKVTGSIKRTDFDISASTPSALLSDEVAMKANVVFIKE